MGVSRHACGQECHDVWMLLGPLHRNHLHPAPEAPLLFLHLQPAPALLPDLLPGSSGILPAGRLGGEGLPGGDGAAGTHCVPAVGG